MKPAIILLASCAMIAAFLALRPAGHPEQEAAPQLTRNPRSSSRPVPFWHSAVVPEPRTSRLPLPEVVAGNPEASRVDHPAEVARLFNTGETDALNFALAAWFDADPAAARDWLGAREMLEPFQTALGMIAGKIAGDGDPSRALEWAALLPPGPEQEQALFDIYVIAARAHQFTEAELKSAPLPPERIRELLSGAPGD
jgi:hypothetical protein